jgi:hypothetical protein
VRATFSVTQMRRGRLHARFCRHDQFVDGPYRPSGHNLCPSGIIPAPIMSPARSRFGRSTEIRLSARAHPINTTHHAHAPPPRRRTVHDNKHQRVLVALNVLHR